jgi:hypothetical protein
LRPLCPPQRFNAERRLEIPTTHRLPLSWMIEAASPVLAYRALAEAAPPAARDPLRLIELRDAAWAWKPAHALARRQKETGLWGGNLLAPQPLRPLGWKKPGTIFQYLRLLELGWPSDQRPFRLAERLLFRLLSRDEDPALLVDLQRPARHDPGLAAWARTMGRAAAAAALARAGHGEDPRLRGTAQRLMGDVSLYLRSPLAEKPFKRVGGKTVLDRAATPPTLFTMVMLAHMPSLQRERAGFLERLAAYVSTPGSKREYHVLAGKVLLPPLFEVLGDPLGADAHGRVKDVPFAVFWLELLARLGILRMVPSAARVAARFFSECDDQGVWSPKSLRTQPKTARTLIGYYYPLEGPGRSPAQRQTDVTFRLALIAQLLGLAVDVA